VLIQISGVPGSPGEGESSTEGCLQRIFTGGEWGPWTMRQECSQIIQQQVQTILAQSGCSTEAKNSANVSTTEILDDAMIMSGGGASVELFIPSRNQTCRLPDSERRYGHTVDGLLLCGGGRTSDTCVTLTEGKWTQSHTNIRRWCATSVKFGSTLYLIGGKSERTTDIVDMSQGGEARPGFELQHDSWWSCAAKDLLQDGFIITGGYIDDELIETGVDLSAVGSKRAHQYNLEGFVKFLPDMNVGRTYHGCGSYVRDDGEQVFMVVGGGHGKRGPAIDSTESLQGLDAKSWTMMTPLPSPMKLPGMVTLGNKLYVAGGEDGIKTSMPTPPTCSDDILAWDHTRNSWDLVGRKSVANTCVTVGTVAMTPELDGHCNANYKPTRVESEVQYQAYPPPGAYPPPPPPNPINKN